MKQVFKIPKGCNRVTIEQQNDKIIIDFKFDSPKDLLFINEMSDMMDSFKHIIPIIKKWREEKTHTNSILKPEFKEGDILVKKYKSGFFGGMEYIFILDNIDIDGLINYKAHYSKVSKMVTIVSGYGIGGIKDSVHLELRYATESEKQLLFDALAKVGKRWNSEKKCIEDLKPKRWRAEEGDPYYYAMPYEGCFGYCCDGIDYRSWQDNKRYKAGNYFKTRAEANSAGLKMKELLIQINP